MRVGRIFFSLGDDSLESKESRYPLGPLPCLVILGKSGRE